MDCVWMVETEKCGGRIAYLETQRDYLTGKDYTSFVFDATQGDTFASKEEAVEAMEWHKLDDVGFSPKQHCFPAEGE